MEFKLDSLMTENLKFSQYNEYSILIEWPAVIDDNMLKEILVFQNKIKYNYIKERVEVVIAYNSILVIYDFTIENVNGKILTLRELFLKQNRAKNSKPLIWEIPVCYDDMFGNDIEKFSKIKKCSKSEIIKLHSEVVYTVFFIGFLPGFLYLGGLNSELFLDRKTTPSLNVKKGSVAIGGQQTGIYPQDSPGGWYVIGNTPIELFDVNQNPPCVIQAGDKLKFVPIDKNEHKDILSAVKTSKYQLKSTITDA